LAPLASGAKVDAGESNLAAQACDHAAPRSAGLRRAAEREPA